MPSPEHDAVVAMMRSMREQRPAPPTLTEQRAQFEAMAELFPLPPEATVEAIDIVGVPAERVSVAGSATDPMGKNRPRSIKRTFDCVETRK